MAEVALSSCQTGTGSKGSRPSVSPSTGQTGPSGMPAPKQGYRYSEPKGFEADDRSLYLFSCSNYMNRPDRIEIGIKRLQRAGFNIYNQYALYRRDLRFAGTDAERASDFGNIASGKLPMPKFLLGVRGGYGAMRILPMVNWERFGAMMKEKGSVLMGFSDVTAVQLAILAKSGAPYYQGPMFQSEFSNPNVSAYTIGNFVRGVTDPNLAVFVPSRVTRRVNAQGIIWGGNLSVLASLAGSPFMPKIDGGILFVEDVSEPVYRIERLFMQLHLAGILQRQKAIVVGGLTSSERADSYDSSYTMAAALDEVSRKTGVPIITGFPFGHIRNKFCFPLGVPATLKTENSGYTITWGPHPLLNERALNLGTMADLDVNNIRSFDLNNLGENDPSAKAMNTQGMPQGQGGPQGGSQGGMPNPNQPGGNPYGVGNGPNPYGPGNMPQGAPGGPYQGMPQGMPQGGSQGGQRPGNNAYQAYPSQGGPVGGANGGGSNPYEILNGDGED